METLEELKHLKERLFRNVLDLHKQLDRTFDENKRLKSKLEHQSVLKIAKNFEELKKMNAYFTLEKGLNHLYKLSFPNFPNSSLIQLR